MWDEVADIAHSARLLIEDRETCERMEQGRLRRDPEIQELRGGKPFPQCGSRTSDSSGTRSLITKIG